MSGKITQVLSHFTEILNAFENFVMMGIALNTLSLIDIPKTQVRVNQYQIKQPTNSCSICGYNYEIYR